MLKKAKVAILLVLALVFALQGIPVAKAEVVNKLTVDYIFDGLGDALNYGVVAETYEQFNHAETSVFVDKLVQGVGEPFLNTETTYMHGRVGALTASVTAPSETSLQGMQFALFTANGDKLTMCDNTVVTISDASNQTELEWTFEQSSPYLKENLYVRQIKNENGQYIVINEGETNNNMTINYGPYLSSAAPSGSYVGSMVSDVSYTSPVKYYNTKAHNPAIEFGPGVRLVVEEWKEDEDGNWAKTGKYVDVTDRKYATPNPTANNTNARVFIQYKSSSGETKYREFEDDIYYEYQNNKGAFYYTGAGGKKYLELTSTTESNKAAELLKDAIAFSKELGNIDGGVINSDAKNIDELKKTQPSTDGNSTVTGPKDENGNVVSIYNVNLDNWEFNAKALEDSIGYEKILIAENEYVVFNVICPAATGTVTMLPASLELYIFDPNKEPDKALWLEGLDSGSSDRVLFNFVYEKDGIYEPFTGEILPASQHGGTLLAPAAYVNAYRSPPNGAIIANKVRNSDGTEIHQRTMTRPNSNTWVRMNGGYITLEKTSVGYDWDDGRWKEMTDNVSLKGAVFGVYSDENCTDLVTTMTTGADGKATSEMIAAGTYWVKEITPLKDHELLEDVVQVTVVAGKEPTKAVGDGYTYHVQGGFMSPGYDVTIVEGKFANQQNEGSASIRIVKQDELGAPVKSAVFGIYSDEDCRQLVGTMTTNKNGVAIYEGLNLRFNYGMHGSKTPKPYYIKEISAPEDYYLDNTKVSVSLTENDRNKLITVDANGSGTDGVAFVNDIKRGNLVLKKTDAATGAALKDVEFGIYSDKDCTNELYVMKTKNNGEANSKDCFTDAEEKRKGLLPGTYYVKEKPYAGYLTNDKVYTVTIVAGKHTDVATNTVVDGPAQSTTITNEKAIKISGTKSWPGVPNADSLTIKVQLWKYAKDNNGTLDWRYVDERQVSVATNWAFSFDELPSQQNGEKIQYQVRESDIPDGWRYKTYVTPVEDPTTGNITVSIVNTLKSTVVQGSKKWTHPLNDNDGRPDSITFNLYQQVGNELIQMKDQNNNVMTYNAQKGNGYFFYFGDLPTYDATGELATYVVKEEASDQYVMVKSEAAEPKAEGDKIVIEMTLTNMLTTSLSGTKVWVDADNANGDRPDEVTLKVYQNGTTPVANPTIEWTNTDQNVWNWTVKDLPRYDAQGNPYTYTVQEDATGLPASYKVSYSDDGLTIYNTKYGRIRLYKESDTEKDPDGTRKRLDGVEFYLYTDEACTNRILTDQKLITSSTSTESGKLTITNVPYGTYWLKEFKALEGYAENNKAYKVVVNGDPSDVEGNAINQDYLNWETNPDAKRNVVLNTKIVASAGSLALKKTDKVTGATLQGAVFDVYAKDGTLKATMQATDANGLASVGNLPAGEYYVQEKTSPENYKLSNEKYNVTVLAGKIVDVKTNTEITDAANATAITNEALVSVKVTKYWVHTGNPDSTPSEIAEVQLLQNGEAYGASVPINGNGTHHTWSNLPKYDERGNAYSYTVSEVESPLGYVYNSELTANKENDYTITNTYINGEVSFQFSATKKLEGGLTDEDFTFRLEATPSEPPEPMPKAVDEDGNEYILDHLEASTKGSADGNTVNFDNITMTSSEFLDLWKRANYWNEPNGEYSMTYHWEIYEVIPTLKNPSVTYDETRYGIFVTVTADAETGTLKITDWRSEGAPQNQTPTGAIEGDTAITVDMDFVNTISDKSITVTKQWVGGTPTDTDLTKKLVLWRTYEGLDTPENVTTVFGDPARGTGEKINEYSWSGLPSYYQVKDADGKTTAWKEYTYYVTEADDAAAGYSVSYANANSTENRHALDGGTITNIQSKAEASVQVKKYLSLLGLNGLTEEQAKTFTFKAKAANTEAMSALNGYYTIENGEVSMTVFQENTDPIEVIAPDPIKFTFTKAGTYTFIVEEVVPSPIPEGMWYSAPQELTIWVEKEDGGSLTARADLPKVEFINYYGYDEDLYINKKWNDANSAVQRPDDIEFKLKYRTVSRDENGNATDYGEWKDYSAYPNAEKYTTTIIKDECTTDCEHNCADHCQWGIRITGLPSYMEGKNVEWAAVETVPSGYTAEYDNSGSGYVGNEKLAFFGDTIINSAPVSISLEAKKTLTGGKTLGAGDFTFILTGDRLPVDGVTEVKESNDANGDVTFDPINFTMADLTKDANGNYEEKTFNYTITEAVPTGATLDENGKPVYNGVTYDNAERKVKVTLSMDGDQLAVDVDYTPDLVGNDSTPPEFVNNYESAGTELEIPFTKTLVNAGSMCDGEEHTFTFTLESAEAALTKSITWKKNAGEPIEDEKSASFILTYGKADTYTYTVTESDVCCNAITGDSKTYTVKVVVADDGNGQLTADVAEILCAGAETDKIAFENTYKVTDISVTKKWVGDEAVKDTKRPESISVVLVANGIELEPVTLNSANNWTDTWNDLPVMANGEEIIYFVNEIDGVEGYATDYSGDVENGFVITNAYGVVSAKIEAAKVLKNALLTEGQFTFELKNANGTVLDTKTNADDGSITFDEIPFTADVLNDFIADENGVKQTAFYYYIVEKNDAQTNILYDPVPEREVQVLVAMNMHTGAMTAEVIHMTAEGTTADDCTFTNTYVKGAVQFTATKVLENADLAKDQFTFQLKDESGTVLDTQTNAAGGAVTFDAINYTLADMTGATTDENGKQRKEINYSISEVIPAGAEKIEEYKYTKDNIVYDAKVYTATAVLTYDPTTGELTAESGYNTEDGSAPTFTNTYVKEVEKTSITVTKEWSDSDNSARPAEIEVQLYDTKGTEATMDDEKVGDPVKLTAPDWSHKWENLPKFVLNADGTESDTAIAYRVDEVKVPDGYYKEITEANGGFAIKNTLAKGDYEITVNKTLINADKLEAKETFAFELYKYDNDAKEKVGSAIATANINIDAATAEGKADATLTFPLVYGKQWYILEEVSGTNANITYADNAYIFQMDARVDHQEKTLGCNDYPLVYDKDGNLLTGYEEAPEFSFTNTYEEEEELSATVQFSAVKTLELADLADYGFEFQLKDADGRVLQTKSHDADGGIIFDEIPYTMDDMTDAVQGAESTRVKEIKYTISEVIPEGAVDNGNGTFTKDDIIYDGTVHKVTAELVYNEATQTLAAYASTDESEPLFTNTWNGEKTYLNVMKVWEDNNNAAGKRPESVTLILLANGEEAGSVVLSESTGWEYRWNDLAATDTAGNPISYTVSEETVADYTFETVQGVVNTRYWNVVNTYTGTVEEKTSITVTKVWNDQDDEAKLRPEEIMVNLLVGSGNLVYETVTLNEANGWTYTWNDLPAKNSEGTAYTYSVDEVTVDGEGNTLAWAKIYTKTINGTMAEGFTITNTYEEEVEKTSITVTKVWEDNDNAAGKRPESIQVVLTMGGGRPPVDAGNAVKVLNEANSWTYTWNDLDVYDGSGNRLEYTVIEKLPAEAAQYYEGATKAVEGGFVLTNTYVEETYSLVLEKADKLDPTKKLPGAVYTVYTDEECKTEYTRITTGEDGTGTLTDVPAGKYWVKETIAPEGYQVDPEVYPVEVPNPEDPTKPAEVKVADYPTTSVAVKKVWVGAAEGATLPEITVQLLADGKAVNGATLKLNAENGWTGTFADLDSYDEITDKAIAYTVAEVKVEGYTTAITGTMAEGFTITNTYVTEEKLGVLMLCKSDRLNADKKLAGAQYTLFTQETCKEEEILVLPDGTKAVITTGADGWGSLTGVPAGTYWVKETKAPVGYEVDPLPYEVVVKAEAQEPAKVEVSDFPLRGALSLSKTVVAQGKTDGSFLFDIVLTRTDSDPIVGSYEATLNGVATKAVTFAADGENAKATVTLKDGETLVIHGLRAGTNYMVSEQPNALYDVKVNDVAATGAVGTISDTALSVVKFQNTLKLTSFAVKKEWTGLSEGERTPAIQLLLYCNGKAVTAATPVPDQNGWYTYTNLPAYVNGEAAVYTVKEVPVTGFTTAYINKGVTAEDAAECAYNGGTIVNSKIPQTGDGTPLALWMLTTLLAACGLLGVTVALRKREN